MFSSSLITFFSKIRQSYQIELSYHFNCLKPLVPLFNSNLFEKSCRITKVQKCISMSSPAIFFFSYNLFENFRSLKNEPSHFLLKSSPYYECHKQDSPSVSLFYDNHVILSRVSADNLTPQITDFELSLTVSLSNSEVGSGCQQSSEPPTSHSPRSFPQALPIEDTPLQKFSETAQMVAMERNEKILLLPVRKANKSDQLYYFSTTLG